MDDQIGSLLTALFKNNPVWHRSFSAAGKSESAEAATNTTDTAKIATTAKIDIKKENFSSSVFSLREINSEWGIPLTSLHHLF